MSLQRRGLRVALGYADCGSYGALDELCARLGIRRLGGLHCYDVFGGASRVRELLEREPGTYLLTDFLVRSFDRTVVAGLGLDRHPELWPDYFRHYRRLVWLAQRRDAVLDRQAHGIAARFGLPLRVIDVGTAGLEQELALLAAEAPADDLAVAGWRGVAAGKRRVMRCCRPQPSSTRYWPGCRAISL